MIRRSAGCVEPGDALGSRNGEPRLAMFHVKHRASHRIQHRDRTADRRPGPTRCLVGDGSHPLRPPHLKATSFSASECGSSVLHSLVVLHKPLERCLRQPRELCDRSPRRPRHRNRDRLGRSDARSRQSIPEGPPRDGGPHPADRRRIPGNIRARSARRGDACWASPAAGNGWPVASQFLPVATPGRDRVLVAS